MKKLKKYYTLIIVFLIILVITILGVLIYINIFKEGNNNRFEGIEKYKLTSEEKDKIEEKLNEIENVNNIDIKVNEESKIIKIFLDLNEDTDSKIIEKISNELIEEISDENLYFYDLEVFVECVDKEKCTMEDKIGYKHKSLSEFTWNR